MKDKIADILKAYTKKKGISASFVILENYAEELVKNGCVIQESKVETTAKEAEIMKALECYRNSKIITTEKGYISIGDIIDLINRKNAEAEAMKAHIRLLESENERLKKIINTSAIILPARKCGKTFLIKTTIEKITESARTAARAEAIKEVLEKVEALFPSDKRITTISRFTLRQISKEMGVEL